VLHCPQLASGARINISEGNCPERIVTITGPTDAIFKAFAMIAYKFEEVDSHGRHRRSSCHVFTSSHHQCGSLIGKGGSKIKEMREVPERIWAPRHAAKLHREGRDHLWTPEAIIQCVKQICVVMLEVQANLDTSITAPHPPMFSIALVCVCFNDDIIALLSSSSPPQQLSKLHQLAMQQTPLYPPRTDHPCLPWYVPTYTTPPLIGCIIGRQGTKINEIRQMSGAQIKIANAMEGSSERQITITGTPANISLAQYLINTPTKLSPTLTLLSETKRDHLSLPRPG
uniref:K Homology domain-containing protein n=1 Tax=Takifugu rubripes TaxID=31033 RepID=A0A674MLZ7_TAKRU